MAYVSGTLNQNARVIVLDSNNNTISTRAQNSGAFKSDKFGDVLTDTTESGTIIAVSDIGETVAYNKIEFGKENDLPTIPWTETFTGTNGSHPTGHMWTRSNSDNVYLNNNKLRLDNTGASNGLIISARSDFLLWGNFDIQTDLDIITGPATNIWVAQIQIRFEPTGNTTSLADFFNVLRFYSGGQKFRASYRIAGTNTDGSEVTSSLTSTKLRVVRQNNLLTGYYWTGSAWTALSSNINFDSADTGGHAPVSVALMLYNSTNYPTAIADFDNFTINSGYINYKYSEAFNGYADGSEPDSNFFDSTTGLTTIQSGKLTISTSASVSRSSTRFKYLLKGNFYIVCNYNMSAAPTSGTWHAQFKTIFDDTNYIAMKRQCWSGTHYITGVSKVNDVSINNNATSNNTGYYMLSRIGTTVYGYYSTNNSTWTLLHTRTDFPTGDLYIQFEVFYTSGTPEVTCEFDLFKIVNKPLNDLKIKFPIDTVA